MSRSVFALRFKETVGTTPMGYLTRWRMLLAGDKLTQSGDSISVIALSLGYESESAFGKAFKKTMGCSPRQYVRSQNPTLALRNEEEDSRTLLSALGPPVPYGRRTGSASHLMAKREAVFK